MLHNFAVSVYSMNKHHGPNYTIKYLKAAQLAIQKKISGSPFNSLRDIEPDLPLPRLSKSGLPALIKLQDRAAIGRNSLTIIRLWLTIFSLYRVLKGPIKPKLSTITDSFGGDDEVIRDFQRFLKHHCLRLLTRFLKYPLSPLSVRADRLTFIVKASPSAKES